MITIEAKQGGILFLGREGETNVRQIVFDISDWVRDLGPGVAQLKNQRMGDIEPYLCPVEQNEDRVYWTITNVETAHHGKYGKCELSYIPNESGLAKSAVWTTIVSDALGEPSAEMPEPMQGYLDQIAAAGAGALASAQRAETARAAAEEAQSKAASAKSASEAIAKEVAQAKSDVLAAQNAAEAAKTKAETAQTNAEKARDAAAKSAEEAKNAASQSGGGGGGAFYAQFGVNTLGEIKAAYASQKAVYVVKDNSVYTMIELTEGSATFRYAISSGIYQETRTILYGGNDNHTGIYRSENNEFSPAVTTYDNGKFLRVVNGAWAAVMLPDVSKEGM